MGNGTSGKTKSSSESRQKNRKIEMQLRKDATAKQKTAKLLILGTAESGKSTILKQMRILHDSGFSEAELYQYRVLIYESLLSAVEAAVNAVLKNWHCANSVLESSQKNDFATVESLFLDIQSLGHKGRYADIFQGMLLIDFLEIGQKSDFSEEFDRTLNECTTAGQANYFLKNLNRLCEADYTPTADDVLRIRQKTTGIVEIAIKFRNTNIRVFDVGGQRSERKKWIHCFDDVTAVLFTASLVDYNKLEDADMKKTRLQESLAVFSFICMNPSFRKSGIVLFLNKSDLFPDQLQSSALSNWFPQYNGPATYDDSLQFITSLYQDENDIKSRPFFTHVTCATDTSQVRYALQSVFELVLKKALEDLGLQ